MIENWRFISGFFLFVPYVLWINSTKKHPNPSPLRSIIENPWSHTSHAHALYLILLPTFIPTLSRPSKETLPEMRVRSSFIGLSNLRASFFLRKSILNLSRQWGGGMHVTWVIYCEELMTIIIICGQAWPILMTLSKRKKLLTFTIN